MNDFQQAFAEALLAPEAPDDALFAQPGFAVVRNTVLKGCIDALEANFPTVARLVGDDWFRSAALAYAREQPPRDSRLLTYGDEGFAVFVQAIPSAAGLPYLAGIAHLDRLWRACHVAADAPVLAAQALAPLAVDALVTQVLRVHPATQWAWFDDQPVARLWCHERAGEPLPEALAWHGDGLLLTRADGAVGWQALSRAGCAVLDACAAGCTLGEAAQHALALDSATNLAQVLQQLLRAGAFTEEPLP
jgi:hypothetical protein